MVKVPTRPIAEGQVSGGATFQSVSSSPDDFGAVGGRALQGLGKTLEVEGERIFAAADRIERGEEALDRVRLLRTANEEIQKAINTEAETGSNFETKDSVTAIRQQIAQTLAQIQGQHKGRPESQLVLEQALVELESRSSALVVAKGVEGRNSAITRELTANQRELGNAVANGMSIDAAFAENAAFVKQFVDTHTPTQTADALLDGQETIITAAFSQAFNTLDVAGARKILKNNSKFLSDSVAQTMRNQLVIAETIDARKTAEINATLERYADITGTTVDRLSKKVVQAAVGIRVPAATRPEQLAEIERLREAAGEEPLTQDQRDKFLGIDADPANITRGRALGILTDPELVVGFGAGTLNASDQLMAEAAIAAVIRPTFNPITQTFEAGVLPPTVLSAMRQQGLSPESFRPGEPPNETPPPVEGDATPAAVIPTGDDPVARVAAVVPELNQFPPGMLGEGKTIFDMANQFTGVTATFKSGIANTPVLGSIGEGFGQAERIVRRQIPLLFRGVANHLREDVRSSVELEALIELLSAEPEFLANPSAFEGDLIGIDNALKVFTDSAEKSLGKEISGPNRARLLDTLAFLENFRTLLLPHRIAETSVEATLKKIKEFNAETAPGTRFLFFDNNRQIYRQGTVKEKAATKEEKP